MIDHTPLHRHDKRFVRQALLQCGAMACGVAAGVVEFLALQRFRLKLHHQRLQGPRHR